MSKDGTFQLLSRHLILALQPIQEAVSDLEGFQLFLLRLGWEVDSLPAEWQQLGTIIQDAFRSLETAGEDLDMDQAIDLIDKARAFYEAIQDLSAAPVRGDPQEFLREIRERLLELLVVEYLAHAFPTAYNALLALDIIQVEYEPETANRSAYQRLRLKLDEISRILNDPLSIGSRVYGWGTHELDFLLITGHLQELFESIGVNTFLQQISDSENPFSVPLTDEVDLFFQTSFGEDSKNWSLLIPFFVDEVDGSPAEVGLALSELPATDSDRPGIILKPLIPPQIKSDFQLGEHLVLRPRPGSDLASLFGVEIRPESINIRYPFNPDQELPAGGYGVELVYRPSESTLLLGDPSSTSVQFKGLTNRLLIDRDNQGLELRFEFSFEDLALLLSSDDQDSFLADLLGGKDTSLAIPFALQWSSRTGIGFSGATGFRLSLSPHLELGPISVNQLDLTLGTENENERLKLEMTAGLAGRLGPLTVVVEGLGLRLAMPIQAGAAGLFDFSVGFKPPAGLGLSVEGGGFSGGGFLRFYEEDERYEGMLELEYEDKLSLKAIGLLITKLPGGKDGFSLLIIITAEFTPIQLGLGFTLNGVGGMLGYNRTADVERLRSGLRDNSLSSVLFPQNIVENASRILSDLNQLFPAQPDRFIFGPMARIGWGSPTLITIDLGLVIEIPSPVRVLILGVIRALLPDEAAKLLQLQVNFLGVIDFEAQRLSFDASLFDSKLLGLTLSGDMAVRLNWGDDSNFLLSVGGFHPAYEPPPLNLPTLRRLTLQLTSGDNPRLTLETYFAITSNTLQFGAKVELLATHSSFSVYGLLSFDVLFQFNPFYFIASISAMLSLRANGSEIASISLDFTLEGPTPWRARGTAKLKICWFLTIKVSFDKTFGEVREILLPDVPVLPLLKAALSDPGNWETQPVSGHHPLVTFKKIEKSNGQVIAAPFGVLTIQQKVVPLEMDIQHFGSQRPADGNRFSIEQVAVGDGKPLEKRNVDEQFAPAQFFEMTEAQKLASKSFERYPSGVRLEDSELLDVEYGVARKVDYEMFYVDEQRDLVPQGEPVQPDVLAFQTWLLRGAVANSPLSQARNGQSALAPGAVRVMQEAFAVVRMSDLRLVEAGAQASSEASAHRMMQNLLRENSALENELLVVPMFEVNYS